MPINKYMLHVDGKDRHVSEENIKQYGMGRYASSYPNATVRMRDDDGTDYDIPIGEYDKAVSSGLHAFLTTYYDPSEKVDATTAGDSIAMMEPPKPQETQTPAPQAATPEQPEDREFTQEEIDSLTAQTMAGARHDGYDPVSKTSSGGVLTEAQKDSAFEAGVRAYNERKQAAQAQRAEQEKKGPASAYPPAPDAWAGQPINDFAQYQETQRQTADWGGTPLRQPESKRQRQVREAMEEQSIIDNLWNSELKGKVDQLIEAGQAEGRKKLAEYTPSIYGRNNFGYGIGGVDNRWAQEYLKAADSKKVIEGVQQYLAEKQGTGGEGTGASGSDPMQEKLMQKVYDYLVQKNTPKSTAEYILRNVMETSILGQLISMGNGKSYEQRQIEAQGLQSYDASTGEEIGAMAASIAADLPVMSLTGAVGGLAGNALLRGATNRLVASGMSEAVARGVAARAAQQGGMKWGIRAASEALNFGTLEGAGSAVGQLYQTGEVDLGDVAQSFAKGTATGAIMGVFGVSNDHFRRMMEGAVGETAGRAIGYGTSLGGRTAILTGSSVMGQYLADPNFDIQNVDWTKEVSHAALMNIGFDILGAAKRYQAERKSGIKMRNLEKLNLTKEDIRELNDAGIDGKNAQEIAESVQNLNDIKSVLGESGIPLSVRSKVAYLMTGQHFNLAPITGVSSSVEGSNGQFYVETYDVSGQVSERRRFTSHKKALNWLLDKREESMHNLANIMGVMVDNARKIYKSTLVFDLVAYMHGDSREHVAEIYGKDINGKWLTYTEKEIADAVDNAFAALENVMRHEFNTTLLKERVAKKFGKDAAWMDEVLKGKYDTENKLAFDAYIDAMREILQGRGTETMGQTAGRDTYQPTEMRPMIEGRVEEPVPPVPGEGPVPGAGPVEGPAPTPSSPREASRQTGAALYAEHDPVKMRQAVVREEVARERALAAVGSEEALERLGELDEAALEEAVAGMDANTQRLVGDWIAQKELADGMNEALDAAHESEIEEAERKVLSMAPIGDEIPLVPLGKYGDSEHTYGVVVSGIDASRQLTNPSGLAVVVPLTNGPAGAPDYNSFDPTNTLSGTFTNDAVRWAHREDVIVSMLPFYEVDARLLDVPVIEPGTTVQIADLDGNVANLHILAQGPGDSWIVQEEGMSGGMEVPEEELAEMMAQAERLPILQEYAELDKSYEREQREKQRQAERQAEREARLAREAEEAARIAEEMKKPINRLAKYPEGHKKAGMPDYESSRPEDVRAYLVESLGLDGAIKSIRSQRAGLERQVDELTNKVSTLIRENEQNDYYPDEAIAAQQYISTQQQELDRLKKRLSFWQNMEVITAGPSEKAIQETVARSQATQKATRTKRDTYKPSDAYVKLKKEISDSSTALDVLNDLEPHTPEELAATLIGGGVRLMKGDETVGGALLRGVMSQTGFGTRDLNRVNFIFATRANGGVSVAEFGEMMETAAQEYGVRFDGKTQEPGVTALLNLLGEVEKMGDITRYVENRRMEEAATLYDAENAAIETAMDEAAWDEYGMSYAELEMLQDAISESLAERKGFYEEFVKTEAYNDFISTFAENKDYGIERKDLTGVAAGSETAGSYVGDGSGRAVEGNQEPAGSVQPVAGLAVEREPSAQDQRGAAIERAADGNEDGVHVSSGPGAGEIEERPADGGSQAAESVSSVRERGSDGAGEGSGLAGKPELPSGYEGAESEAGSGTEPGYTVEKRHHAQQNKDIWAVKFEERFDRDKFLELKDEAKKYGGYYSRFGKGGFIFKTEEDARKFGESVVGARDSRNSGESGVDAGDRTNELKPSYDEQGRETIESQAGHSRSEAERLANETEPGSVEDAPATGRGSGTSGNRPVASGSERPSQVNGYRLGEKVVYKGQEATIYDFEKDGTPVLDTGMGPVIYEVGRWEDIQKLPASREQAVSMAQARTPEKQLERAEQRQQREKPKREKQKAQMADLFAQADALDEVLTRQEQEIDAQLALMVEYKAGPKAQVREDMHTGAAKTLEKAARKLAKALANRLGGHVDGKDITRGLTNIAPIGGDVTIRVWMDDARTNGVLMNITFDAVPDTRDFDKLVPKYGMWRLIAGDDPQGIKSRNVMIDELNDVSEMQSGAFLSKVADRMLEEITRNARYSGQARDGFSGQARDVSSGQAETNDVLTNKEKDNDGRRNRQANSGTPGTGEGIVPDGRTEGNPPADQGVGTAAREETERADRGRDGGSVHGNHVPDTEGSGRVSGSDGEQFTPIGNGPFGKIYNQFKGRIKDAFKFLISNKSGDLLGVFTRKEIGDIDLVWGDEKKGFKHIIDEHVNVIDPDFASIEEAADKIEDIITNGVISKDGTAKATIEKDGYRVIVSKNIEGERKNWVLTAYDSTNGKGKRKEKTSLSVTPITPNTIEGSRAVASKEVFSSEDKDSELRNTIKRNTNNFSYGEAHLELPTGEIGKLKGNIEAIRTLKELEASGQPATPEQKQALLKFVGWGGLAEALNSAEYADWQRKLDGARRWGWDLSTISTPWSKKWGKHYEELRPLMSDEEWATAQASTLNSHYTPEPVIRGLWQALEYMGFKGGSIQEPAMGIGHILGFMPKHISERSLISGFELDGIPGRIAKQLYPDADITVAGYETVFRPASKDAIVTNVPFGQTAPVDPALDKALRKKIGGAYNLHNYFIIKGLLELRPGGVGAFITSASTLDGRNTKAREYIAGMGVDLVGAIRLPNNTFKDNAGTEVTADMLFYRKRLPGERSNGIAFTSLSQVGTGTYKTKDKNGNEELAEVPLLVNEYFAEHPEMMLGTVMTAHDAGSGGLYGGDNLTLVARPNTELSAELADAIGRLPEGVYGKTLVDMVSSKKEKTTQKDGALSVKGGRVYVASKGELSEIASGSFKHNGKTRSYADATTDYQALKETLKELIKAEQTQVKDPTALREKLNEQYDRFVEKYGRLNENKNLNVVLEEDPERFLPQSLEKVETVTNPTTGRRTKVVSKGTGILSQRVSQPMTEPTTAGNLSDAIGISQSYRGHMDVDYIANMLGIPADEARDRILTEREAYEDPITGELVDRDAYLSGNVREKLENARAAAEHDPRYESNVADLEKAMPESIPFVDIFYKMGSPWIPVDVYETFAREVCGIDGLEIRYSPVIDQFVIVSKGYINDHVKANNFSTDRRDVKQLFEDAINLRKPTIYDTVQQGGVKRQVKNEADTQAAISAIMDMNDAFVQYVQGAKEHHARLTSIYNDRYNNYRLREYREPSFKGADGKVHYPNANPGITLRTHQVKAVQRSLQGSTLLAHQVGTGKTFTMITTAMEMRRLGIAKKPMIVVQNATLQDFAADFMKLYPGAKILVPNETERSASQRKRLFNLIATGDFDAIIVPQSFLAFIPDDEGRKKALIQKRVDEMMAAADEIAFTDKALANRLKREAEAIALTLREDKDLAPKKGKRVKDQAKQQEKAVVRETKKLDRRTDDVLTFEQMGVDALFIDEAHNYKKVGFTTKMQNVKGVDTGYSERANSLYLKVTYVQEKMGGRNVILATGTPITNTMAEVWTMMRFVAPEILEDYGIRTFDEFAATFGQVEPSLEQNSTGGFKIADRFKSYVNVPELVKAFRSHADVVLTSDVQEFKQSKNIPKLKDGRMTNHVIQKSDQLQEVMDVLIEALKEDEKKSGNDKTPGLPLVVFSKAKQAAIDLRLINPEYPDDPDSKTNKVVSEVVRIYRESTPDKGIQMIFCDSYQSPSSEPAIDLFDYNPEVPQFNLYRDIKQKLIEQGIPKEEIVIVSEISNADRKKAVFEKARAGEVRVLIGGTEKMGVGVNVQDRMIALHHMDAPIRPMDFEQRNGRILRQGNMFAAMDKPVEVVTYGVEGTLDATAYERLRIKQEFINQMMKGDVSGRVMEEQDDEDPSGKTFSQMAAELSGDKTLQLLFIAENNVKKLEGLRRSFELRKENARMDASLSKSNLASLRRELKVAEKLAKEVAERFPDGITQLTINGNPVTEKMSKELADMLERYEDRYSKNRSVVFPVVLLNNGDAKIVFGHTLGQLQYSLYVDEHALVEEKPIHSYAGVWLSVNSALGNTGKRVKEIEEKIRGYESRIEGAESLQSKEFDKMDELIAARQEVKNLKAELAKKAEKPVPSAEEVKLAKKNLKSGEKPVSLPEEMAGDSEESLDRMVTAMQPFESVAANAPEMVIAQSTSDILKAMPGIGSLQFAAIVREASRPEVQAMYVPWTRQIILLPNKGTVKEMRDKRWHESLHFGIDMVLPKDDAGRLMMERAGSEVDQLSPELAAWVKDTYGDRNVAEEKVVHLVEEFISYLEDTGKVRSLLGGVDFGSRYPVLNDVVNRVINYLTNNGHGKESDNYRGYDEGSEPAYRGEGEEGRVEEDFAAVRDEQRIKEERIEKLRNSENASIVGNEIPITDDYKQNKKNAIEYGKTLKGEYTNLDTGKKVSLTSSKKNGGLYEILQHDYKDAEHIQSIAAIPQIIEKSIYIDTIENEDKVNHPQIESYDYYVCGLTIGNEEYTVKAVVSNMEDGSRYYDHKLTAIEKGRLIDLINKAPESSVSISTQTPETDALSGIKDKRLLSILQTNPSKNEEIKLGMRGKPRRKQGESIISFNKRLKEWRSKMEAAKRTRAVENLDAVNPVDEELNNLAMEMMEHPVPIRKPGESDEDFTARQAEWSEWYNNRLPEINARMSELKAELERQSSNARSKEIKETESPLYTGEVPPQKDETGELTDEEMREVRESFQEKMKDAQISVTKDQIRRDIKQEIIERRRYIETSNLEDAFFVDQVKKSAGSAEVLKALPDYIEGTYTGEETPELMNTAKMVKDWFEEVYNLMAQEGVLYDAPKIQNYVTHIWDWKRSPKEAQERYTNWVNTMRLRSPFTKHRVIPSYKEGMAMGMVPKYDDITGILLEYGHYATETIANKRMLEFLKNFRVFIEGGKDNLPMEVDVIVPETVKDANYSRMNHTALEGYKVLNAIKPFITPVFGDQRIIDPSHLNPLTNRLIDGVWATSGLMKKIALSFSFFHHGALTETAIAMMKPHHAAKVIAKNLFWDVITKGNIPAMNDKEAARDAVKHLVSLGASNDYVTADVNNLTTQLHRWTKDKHIPVAQQAAYVLDFLNKGSDKILWDTIHDGYKIASFEMMAREIRAKAKREGWSHDDLEKSLDEAGHLVNDTYGGLHFDILGFSPKSVRIMRALLLSPDWTLATVRQALSPFGFGKLYGDEGFWRTIGGGENPVKTRKKYGRAFWLTAMVFFYGLMNGLNAYFRAKDEEGMRQEAEEMRKVDKTYKSPYELAYPNGMKWHDYLMPGNTLSHQTHLFTGRYEDGTERYARWGKQFRELPELFFGRDGFSFPGPMIDKLSGKANPFLASVFEFVSGHSLSGWENVHMKDKKGWERDVARLYLLASKFVPYSVPTQEDKDFYWLDLVMPSSKGFTPGKAINYFEKAILSGDMNFVAGVYNACVTNGLQPEKYFNVAKARIEAEAKAESLEDVETLQDATKKFDDTTDLKERKRLLRYMEQQIGAQDYRAISQEELLQQAIDLINGEMPDPSASDRYLESSSSDDFIEDYRMKKNAAGLKKYYQDYTGLAAEDPEAAKLMYAEKRKYIEGYVVTTKYRSAINKLKKALTREGADSVLILKEIRKLRKEYFDTMDSMELQ